MSAPDRVNLTDDLEIPCVVTGLWQVADMEKDGSAVDLDGAAAALSRYVSSGFDAFDVADHYGSAELIAGRLAAGSKGDKRATVFTKWVPPLGDMTADTVRAGIEERLERLGTDCIDLLQLHWWDFSHLAYLDAARELTKLRQEGMIRQIGVTNFNTDHLRVLIGEGVPVVSNQVSFSLVDRRAAEDMQVFCNTHGVRLLAYGTLCGGLLAQRWCGADDPAIDGLSDWSKMKYRRFIEAAGGWSRFQGLLDVLGDVAGKHGVSVSNVATRWVLDHDHVAAVIVGARPGENDHCADNLNISDLKLDAEDRDALQAVVNGLDRIPGDCGDEYRRPPYLTASGDLSHHPGSEAQYYRSVTVEDRGRVDSGSVWESICGFSRAVRVGERILVSGTTATHSDGSDVCPDDAAGQAVYILDKISASLIALAVLSMTSCAPGYTWHGKMTGKTFRGCTAGTSARCGRRTRSTRCRG